MIDKVSLDQFFGNNYLNKLKSILVKVEQTKYLVIKRCLLKFLEINDEVIRQVQGSCDKIFYFEDIVGNLDTFQEFLQKNESQPIIFWITDDYIDTLE